MLTYVSYFLFFIFVFGYPDAPKEIFWKCNYIYLDENNKDISQVSSCLVSYSPVQGLTTFNLLSKELIDNWKFNTWLCSMSEKFSLYHLTLCFMYVIFFIFWMMLCQLKNVKFVQCFRWNTSFNQKRSVSSCAKCIVLFPVSLEFMYGFCTREFAFKWLHNGYSRGKTHLWILGLNPW